MPGQAASTLDWNLVRTFIAVVRSGSLAAAARDLGFAHPTVARHVQLLEESVGLVLFDRTTQGLQLNDAGHRLADAATDMQRSALAFASATDAVRVAPPPVVRITVADVLADLVPDFLTAPDCLDDPAKGSSAGLRVELDVSNQQLNLLERDADIAVRLARPQQQDLIARHLGELSMGAFVSPEYFQQHGPITADNLATLGVIDGLSQPHFQEAAATLGWVIEDQQVVFRSDCVSARRAAMLAGVGIAGLPRYMVAPDEGQAVTGSWATGGSVELPVWLVARPELRNNVGFQTLFERLGNYLQQRLLAQDT